VQYIIESLFTARRHKFKDHPSVTEELDLVEEEDKITHQIELTSDSMNLAEEANYFKFDENYEKNEDEWAEIRKEILGEEEERVTKRVDAYSDSSSDEEEEVKDDVIQDETE